MEWRDLKLSLRNAAAREVDRLVSKIDARDPPKSARFGCPAKVVSGPAARIQQPRPTLNATAEQSPFDRAGTSVPPAAFVRRINSLVVVDGDAGGDRGRFHASKCISGQLNWLPFSG